MDLGYLSYLALLFYTVERRCENLSTVAPRRYEAPSTLPWEVMIVPGEDKNPDAIRQAAELRFFYNNLVATDALENDKRGGVAMVLRHMNRCVGHFYAVHEAIYNPQPPVWDESGDLPRLKAGLTAEYRLCPNWWFEVISGKLRYLTYNFEAFGSEMNDEDWVIAVGQGLMMPSVINYLFQKMSLNDWVIFNRDLGRDLIHATTTAKKGTPEWKEFRNVLKDIYGSKILITNPDDKVEFGKGADSPSTFDALIERLEKRVMRMWGGGDLKHQSSGGGGHNVGSKMQEKEDVKLLRSDAKRLEECCNERIDRPVLRWYHGPDVIPLAYFRLVLPKEKDDKAELDTASGLVGMGAKIKLGDLSERTGWRIDNGEEFATAPKGNAGPTEGNDVAAFANERRPRALPAVREMLNTRTAPAATPRDATLKALFAPFGPVAKRLQEIADETDDAKFDALVAGLRDDLPQFETEILKGDAGAAEIAREMIATFIKGIHQARASTTQHPVHRLAAAINGGAPRRKA